MPPPFDGVALDAAMNAASRAVSQRVEQTLEPLDSLRSHVLRLLGARGRSLLSNRALRVNVLTLLGLLLTALLTLLIPVWLIALGPLVLGVPHLLADGRYLVVRQGLLSRPWVATLLFVPLAATWFVPDLSLGLVSVVSVALAARGALLRKAVVMGAALIAIGLSRAFRDQAAIVFAHAHNLIALGILFFWTRERGLLRWLTVAASAAVFSWIALGGADATVHAIGSTSSDALGVTLSRFASPLSPVSSPELAERFVLLFAFGQSLHYFVWLRLIPEEDRERAGIRSFRSSFRALAADVGIAVLVGAGALTLFFVAYAAYDMLAARNGYLRLALFHGPLELAVLGLLFIEGRTPLGTRRSSP